MTRELGNTLGVAVVGSVFASLYVAELSGAAARTLPGAAVAHAKDSIGAALVTSHALAQHGATVEADGLREVATIGFLNGLHAGCLVVAGVCVAGAVFCGLVLPSQPRAMPTGNLGLAQATESA